MKVITIVHAKDGDGFETVEMEVHDPDAVLIVNFPEGRMQLDVNGPVETKDSSGGVVDASTFIKSVMESPPPFAPPPPAPPFSGQIGTLSGLDIASELRPRIMQVYDRYLESFNLRFPVEPEKLDGN